MDNSLEILCENVENATMKSGDDALIITIVFRNVSSRQLRFIPRKATYLTTAGEELEQDVWLSGQIIGEKQTTIRSGAFKKMGIVFYRQRLSHMSVGDKVFLHVDFPDEDRRIANEFRCWSEQPWLFERGSSEYEDIEVSPDSASLTRRLNHRIERLELLEDKLGITLDGLYIKGCTLADHYSLEILGEAKLRDFSRQQSLNIRATVYDRAERVIATGQHYIRLSDEEPVRPFSIYVHSIQEVPSKIRIHPTTSSI